MKKRKILASAILVSILMSQTLAFSENYTEKKVINIGEVFSPSNGSFTVTETGNASENTFGGAINNKGNLTLNNINFTNNTVQTDGSGNTNFANGGAIYSEKGFTAIGGTYAGNKAYSRVTDTSLTASADTVGGAIAISTTGSSEITNIIGAGFENNRTQYDKLGSVETVGSGGAIYNKSGTLNISGSSFSGNQSGQGGAIFTDAKTVIANTNFQNNSATGQGGAIYVSGSGNDKSLAIIADGADVSFSGNTDGTGSNAVYNLGTVDLIASGSNKITLSDKISGSNGIININNTANTNSYKISNGSGVSDKAVSAITNSSSVVFNNNVTGNEVRVFAGTLDNNSEIDGALTINGGIVDNTDTNSNIKGNVTVKGGKLTTNADKLASAGSSTISVGAGEIEFTGGSVQHNIVGIDNGSGTKTGGTLLMNAGDDGTVTIGKQISDQTISLVSGTTALDVTGGGNISSSVLKGGNGVLSLIDGVYNDVNLGTINSSSGAVKVALEVDFATNKADTINAVNLSQDGIVISNIKVNGIPAQTISSIKVVNDSIMSKVKVNNISVDDGSLAGGLLLSYNKTNGNIDCGHSTLANAIQSNIDTKNYSLKTTNNGESIDGVLDLNGTSLTITGNNKTISSGNGNTNNGININGKKLIVNDATLSGFKTAVVNTTASGEVTLKNVTASGNSVDVDNSGATAGTVNLENVVMNTVINDGETNGVTITGNAADKNIITTIKDSSNDGSLGKLTIGNGDTTADIATITNIAQKNVYILSDGKLNIAADKLVTKSATNNNGYLNLTGNNSGVETKSIITGDGKTTIKSGKVVVKKDISQKNIEVQGSSTLVNEKTIETTDDILNNGTLKNNASTAKIQGGDIKNVGKIVNTQGEISAKIINGDDTVSPKKSGTVENKGTISADIENKVGTVSNFGSVTGVIKNANGATVYNKAESGLTGQIKDIENSGNFQNNGNVSGTLTNNSITANTGTIAKVFNNAGATINNTGTIATLNNYGESAPNAGDAGVVNTVANGITQPSINNGVLNLNNGNGTDEQSTISATITGSGTTNILNNITNNGSITQGSMDLKSGNTLTNKGTIIAPIEVENGSKLALEKGSNVTGNITLDASNSTLTITDNGAINGKVKTDNSGNIELVADSMELKTSASMPNVESVDGTGSGQYQISATTKTGSDKTVTIDSAIAGATAVNISNNTKAKITDTAFNSITNPDVKVNVGNASDLTVSNVGGSDLNLNTDIQSSSGTYNVAIENSSSATTNLNGTILGAKKITVNSGNFNINVDPMTSTSQKIGNSELVLNSGVNVDITSASKGKVSIDNDITGSGSNKLSLKGDAGAPASTFNPGTDFSINRNNTIKDVNIELVTGKLTLPSESVLSGSSTVHVDSGATLSTIDGALTSYTGIITVDDSANVQYDVDVLSQKTDDFSNINFTGTDLTLTDVGVKNLDKIVWRDTKIDIWNNCGLRDMSNFVIGDELLTKTFYAMTPIRIMAARVHEDGIMQILPSSGRNVYKDYNPAIVASPIAAQIGGYLQQLHSYDEAFRNMDMYMLMTQKQRQAIKLRNKYAAASSDIVTFDPNQTMYEKAGAWFRPYATFEKVDLKYGPEVSNVAYGSYFGGESSLKDLGNGWDGMYGAYIGYNGSHQAYQGVGIYQNGLTLGAVGMAYKGNFFTGLTANVGANIAEATTFYGHDNFEMLMSGVASKTGYNWELADGKFIIQPSYMMSYSFVHTFDYTNAAGVRLSADPLHVIQFEPGVKFIGNLKNGWQPYVGVSFIWNILDKSDVMANDIALPQMSVRPYAKYGVGVRKIWGERFAGFFQMYFTSGGRDGVGFQTGLRWTIGGKSTKSSSGKSDRKLVNTQNIKTNDENTKTKKAGFLSKVIDKMDGVPISTMTSYSEKPVIKKI